MDTGSLPISISTGKVGCSHACSRPETKEKIFGLSPISATALGFCHSLVKPGAIEGRQWHINLSNSRTVLTRTLNIASCPLLQSLPPSVFPVAPSWALVLQDNRDRFLVAAVPSLSGKDLFSNTIHNFRETRFIDKSQ